MSDSVEPTLELATNRPDDFCFSTNEGSPINIDLKKIVRNPKNIPVTFSAELALGGELPSGLTCSPEGVISGIPSVDTAGILPYDVLVVVTPKTGTPLIFDLYITISSTERQGITYPIESGEMSRRLEEDAMKMIYGVDMDKIDKYWELFSSDGDLPDLETLLTRKVAPEDVYHMLERFATLTIWNADDLSPAETGKPLELEGVSPHYQVFDFGSALVGAPKDLYATNRVLSDSLQTARAMIREVQKRKWKILLSGFDKMVTAAWVEVNRLNALTPERPIEVEDFTPTKADYDVLSHSLDKRIEG